MSYKELTPKTVQKLREFVGWFGIVESPSYIEITMGPGVKTVKGFKVQCTYTILWACANDEDVYSCISFKQGGGMYYLPDDMEERAFEMGSKVELMSSDIKNLHNTGVEAWFFSRKILNYIDNAIPFDPTHYTEEISRVMEFWGLKEEYERKKGELLEVTEEIEAFKLEVIRRQNEAKPKNWSPQNVGKPKPEVKTENTSTQTTTSDSTEVGAVIAFLILLGSVIVFITYVKTF